MTQRIIIAVNAEQRVLLLKRYNYISDHITYTIIIIIIILYNTHQQARRPCGTYNNNNMIYRYRLQSAATR